MFNVLMPEPNTLEDSFSAWALAARDARLAWDAWRTSTARDRGAQYARYRRSLDREEQAAAALAIASPLATGRLA